MAVRTALGYSGLVGTVVLYEVNGRQLMRAKPKKRKKLDKGTKARNKIFGEVSRWGTRMINDLKQQLLFPFTLGTYNRLRGWMRNEYVAYKDASAWELVAKNNQMTQLNTGTDLRDFLEASFSVKDEGNGIITIGIPSINPARNIKAPLRTTKINMKMLVVGSSFDYEGTKQRLMMAEYAFNYADNIQPAKTFTIDTNSGSESTTGNIVLVAIALEFETTDTGVGIYNKDERWLPAAVIAMGRLS